MEERERRAAAIPNRIRPTTMPPFFLSPNNKDDASHRLLQRREEKRKERSRRRQFETMMGRRPTDWLDLPSPSISDGLSKSREERKKERQLCSLLPSSSSFHPPSLRSSISLSPSIGEKSLGLVVVCSTPTRSTTNTIWRKKMWGRGGGGRRKRERERSPNQLS